jgi:glycosyltransferase involved in cell wall biosynthesis
MVESHQSSRTHKNRQSSTRGTEDVKRILVVMNDWPWKMIGGSNYHMLKVIEGWSDDNEIDILLPRLGYTYAQAYLNAPDNLIVTDSVFEREMQEGFGKALITCSRILRVLRSPPRERYDVVVAASHFIDDVFPAAYLWYKNPACKFVGYHHVGLVSGGSRMFLLRRVNDAISVALLRKYADLIFVMNQSIKDFLISNRVEESKILLTNNGVDKITSKVDPKLPVFEACFVGRLEKDKGVFDLVAIWKEVSATIPTAKLAIIGDGSEKNHLIDLIEKEQLQERITLCGYLGDERFEIMRKSKLFLLPSYLEAWPITIVEAMSCGLSVIVYNLPELRALWGSSISYVPKGDRVSFAKTVVELLQDSELRSELSRRGLEKSRGYLWANIATYEANAIGSL